MPQPSRGLYELLVTRGLDARLQQLAAGFHAQRDDLRTAEAADRIALHLQRVLERAIHDIGEESRVEKGLAFAGEIVARLEALLGASALLDEAPVADKSVLRAILARRPDGSVETLEEPLIPLLDTALLTNAPGEPRVGEQISREIASADRVDVVMAFIRRSGIKPLLEPLRRWCADGRQLRVLTTTYTGSTEARALDLLQALGAQIKVSYDTTTTRLHAKSWLFHRESGFSTAYVGSSNLTHSAQVTGLEWNVRVSGARNRAVIEKIAAVFETYWNSRDFELYDHDVFVERSERADATGPTVLLSPIELRLEPFQERLLEQIALARESGHHRNLLVAATGTGKTVMAAVDYARLLAILPRARLLFVAHREELLEQGRATFRHALRDHSFGELWVGGQRPERFEHVFASVQSLARADLALLEPRHFDVVVVDEFHHAAAPSYRSLLDHVKPIELLGLTATPERSDGLPILGWFDDRIAAELRLWDAIDQQRLVPFAYFGVHDGTVLTGIPWRRGSGYDVEGLTNVLTCNDAWVHLVLKQVAEHVDDVAKMRALGFCVSVDHARFMARKFRDAGIAATAVWGDSPEDERRAALAQLARREVNVVFSVDLFNEGIDVPAVDTLLLLRPTDSPTLFLQQLGRGLRRHTGKSTCTVLDFVGTHRKEFRFDRRFRALLGGSRAELERQVEGGFPFLPAGCHLELDPVAAKIVLASIRSSIPSRWTEKVDELRAMTRGGRVPRLAEFIDGIGLELEDLYSGNRSWSELREAAGLPVASNGPHEIELRRAIGRLLHVDDRERIDAYRELLDAAAPPAIGTLGERERRLARMLAASLVTKIPEPAVGRSTTIAEAWALIWNHPQVRAELLELLNALEPRIDHLHAELSTLREIPLRLHARYTRIEILAACGKGESARVAPWREGVRWEKEARVDLLPFTLDKTNGHFSPTTRYRDYAISRDEIHWESQSGTSPESDTGQRYQHHKQLGTSILLFARHHDGERHFWFLGPARYVSHESSRPMAITWRLDHPLPGDLFAEFAAAVA